MPERNYRQLILDSTRCVVERARDVTISETGIAALTTGLAEQSERLTQAPARRDHDSHLFMDDDEHAQWLFALDALNFSYWNDRGDERWRWPTTNIGEGEYLKGAIAMGESFRDAQRRGVPMTDAAFYAGVKPDALRKVLGGVGPMPMLEERCRVLNELGTGLIRHYGGQTANLIEAAGGSVGRLLSLIVEHFPSFRDYATLDGHAIYFLKRGQIFASDLFLIFGGESLGAFGDVEKLTAFSDYKLPQILRAAGVLTYTSELARLVDGEEHIEHGSRREIEIRAATVQAVERLRESLTRTLGRPILTCTLDNCLWALSHSPEFESPAPHHRTRTIFY